MNILYIGPYREESVEGVRSSCILQTLIAVKKHNIIARPLYTDRAATKKTKDILPTEIVAAEENHTDTIDCIIQHTPVSLAIKIHAVSKNIIIPIMDSLSIDEETIQRLDMFDAIWMDTKIEVYKLQKNAPSLQKKIKHFTYDLYFPPINDGKFNISIIAAMHKLYFIGKYKDNIRIIKKLIQSFIQHVGSANHSLVLFLLDIDYQHKYKLDDYILHTYKQYGIEHTINKVVIAPIECKLENVVLAHQTGDTFLDINNKTSNSLHLHIAKGLKKQVLYFDNDLSFVLQDDQDNDYGGFWVLSDHSIYDTIKKYIKSKTVNPEPLFKTQPISSLI